MKEQPDTGLFQFFVFLCLQIPVVRFPDQSLCSAGLFQNHYHRQQTEVFYALNNLGYFIVNGENIKLEVGDLLLVEPGENHTVANDNSEEFKFLAIKLDNNKKDTFTD